MNEAAPASDPALMTAEEALAAAAPPPRGFFCRSSGPASSRPTGSSLRFRVDFDDAVDRDDAGAAVGCGGEATASAAGAANSSLSFRHSKDSRKRDSVFGAATSTTSPTSPVSAASPHGDGALNELFHEMHGAQVPLDGRGVVLGVITRLPATRERVTSGAAAPKSSDS